MTRHRQSERGSAPVELVLVTPLLVGLLLFVVGLGRLAGAAGDVETAAREAARAASNERSSSAARQAGTEAASTTLRDRGVECRSLSVEIDAAQFRADGFVTAAVRCTVDLQDATMIGFPGAKTLSAAFTAPVDRYRGTDQ
ncbi:MAG: TadE/TadG family type IV pilus assembly protein [Acidimicrobiales bacterium]